jgi:hypothetical protein
MRNGGSRNSLNGQEYTVGGRPTGGGVNTQIPRDHAVVRRDRNGHGHNGKSAAGHPPFSRSEPAPSAKHASDAPKPGPAASRPQDDPRLEALRLIAGRLKRLPWTPALLALLLDELYVDDLFTTVIGDPDAIPPHDYARAVAVALVLRHSWQPDDLEAVADRLGVINARRERHPRTRA